MLAFDYPWVLLLVILPWFVHRWFPKADVRQAQALKIPFLKAVQRWAKPYKARHFKSHTRMMAVLIWVLLVLAAMGPSWVGEPVTLSRQGRDIVLALDVSLSMQMQDMTWRKQQVDRFTVVKAVASSFIEQRQGDRIALILFGSQAYIQTPLTFDVKTVNYMLDDASIGLAGSQTALGDAIGLAVKHLKKSKSSEKVLVLLTDGAHNAGNVDPQNAADLALQHGVKIYTIGLGAERLLVPGILGTREVNPSADLDEETLKAIAKKTGGVFFRSTDSKSLEKIYQKIDALEPKAYDGGVYLPKQSYFHWPLALALVLSLVLALIRQRQGEA